MFLSKAEVRPLSETLHRSSRSSIHYVLRLLHVVQECSATDPD
jgi:hypothetical protein